MLQKISYLLNSLSNLLTSKKVNELKFQELQEETIRFEVGSTAEAGGS